LLCDELHALLHDATAIKYLVATTAPAALTMLSSIQQLALQLHQMLIQQLQKQFLTQQLVSTAT